jgi:hypothetical protein
MHAAKPHVHTSFSPFGNGRVNVGILEEVSFATTMTLYLSRFGNEIEQVLA